ncbi:YqgE/AlgH family protein [Pseudoroseicyclus sp. H15]
MDDTSTSLAGQLLVALPDMGDPRFSRAVVYICAHGEDGALGLIVNKPTPEIRFAELLRQLGIEPGGGMGDIRVHFGGPVEPQRGFVLHSADYEGGEATLPVDGEVAMSATTDILRDIAEGTGPQHSMMALGYAGWGPGQLEEELARNDWLTAPARGEILFGRAAEHKWAAALKGLGIDPAGLSSSSGRA